MKKWIAIGALLILAIIVFLFRKKVMALFAPGNSANKNDKDMNREKERLRFVRNNVIRNDSAGSGEYGASRDGGTRDHDGIDIVVIPGENVYAPISGKYRNGIVSTSNPERKLVAIANGNEEVKIMYVAGTLPDNVMVTEGDIIGIAQNVAAFYNSSTMLPHAHVEHLINGEHIDPTNLIFNA